MNSGQRLKVLVSAYACSPLKGSEPAVGWGFVLAMAERHDLWVIVEEEKFRSDIEGWQRANPEYADRIHFYFLHKRRNRWLRRLWPPSYYWYYRRWHRDALALARQLNEEVGFDLAHQLTMVGYREPGYLWRLDLPFVWGPVGGMGFFPWGFLGSVGARGALYYVGYNTYNWLQARLLRRPKVAAQRAGSGLVFATNENRVAGERQWGCTGLVIPEVGLPPVSPNSINRRESGEAMRIIWSGQHTPRKALNIGLLALAKLPPQASWELHVLGVGPQTSKWRKLAEQLDLSSHCHFHGQLTREDALSLMESGHLMLITSLRDLTATVTIEAMAAGLPIVCPDHCGFSDAVTEDCGFKVSTDSPDAMVEGLARSLGELCRDEALRHKLARGALVRAQQYGWGRKGELMDEVYRARHNEHLEELDGGRSL